MKKTLALTAVILAFSGILLAFQNCASSFSPLVGNSLSQENRNPASPDNAVLPNPTPAGPTVIKPNRKISYIGHYTVAPPAQVISSGVMMTKLSPCVDFLVTKDPAGVKVLNSASLGVIGIAPVATTDLGVQTYKISDSECIIQVGAKAYELSVANPTSPALVELSITEVNQKFSEYYSGIGGAGAAYYPNPSGSEVQIRKPSNSPPGYVLLSTITKPGYSAKEALTAEGSRLLVVWRKDNLNSSDPVSPEDQLGIIYDMTSPASPIIMATSPIPRQDAKFLLSAATVFAFSQTEVTAVGFGNLSLPSILGIVPVSIPDPSGMSLISDELSGKAHDGPIVLMDGGEAYVFKIENL